MADLGTSIDIVDFTHELADGTAGYPGDPGLRLTRAHDQPLPVDSRLRTHPRTILTPHAAFYATDSLRVLQRLAAEEAGRALRGEALRCPVVDAPPPDAPPGDRAG